MGEMTSYLNFFLLNVLPILEYFTTHGIFNDLIQFTQKTSVCIKNLRFERNSSLNAHLSSPTPHRGSWAWLKVVCCFLLLLS